VEEKQGVTSRAALRDLREGERVERSGCRKVGEERWCQIRTTGDVTGAGWVDDRYSSKR
jgi:hypothetical protein